MKLYKAIANHISRVEHFESDAHADYERAAVIRDGIEALVKAHMPSGSGIDNGTKIDLHASNRVKLVFTFGFHHMDEHGGYDGWTEHKLYVRPDFLFDITLNITGRNRNDIKEYLHGVYTHALNFEVPFAIFPGETA